MRLPTRQDGVKNRDKVYFIELYRWGYETWPCLFRAKGKPNITSPWWENKRCLRNPVKQDNDLAMLQLPDTKFFKKSNHAKDKLTWISTPTSGQRTEKIIAGFSAASNFTALIPSRSIRLMFANFSGFAF